MSLPADQMLAAFPGALSPRAVPVSVPTQESWTSDSNQARLPRPSPSLFSLALNLSLGQELPRPVVIQLHSASKNTPFPHCHSYSSPRQSPLSFYPTHTLAPYTSALLRSSASGKGMAVCQKSRPRDLAKTALHTAFHVAASSVLCIPPTLLKDFYCHVGLLVVEIKFVLFIPTIPSMTNESKSNKKDTACFFNFIYFIKNKQKMLMYLY